MTLQPVPELPEGEPAAQQVADLTGVPVGGPTEGGRIHSMTGALVPLVEDGSGGSSRPTLSVAELQDALRAARARAIPRTAARLTAAAPSPIGASLSLLAEAARRRVVVLAAHGGAGASTVALALAEAVRAGGRLAHLIECARPPRSGLLTAATAELGLDGSGRWRRGTRGDVVIDRLTGDAGPVELRWPEDPASDREGMTIVDAGTDGPPDGWGDTPLVVVCRATVPGLRRTEHLLHRLARPVSVAVVGPRRWPGPVRASVGPRLAECRRAGQVVAVPLDRTLELTGVHAAPLSRPLAESGRALLDALDAAAGGGWGSGGAAPRPAGVLLPC